MRQIITDDFFRIALIIKKKNLQSFVVEKSKLLSDISNDDGQFGMALFLELMSDQNTKSAVYEFLSPIFECDDVGKMTFSELWANIQTLIEENDLMDFFGTVERLLKTKSIS